jgi:hypothetical protein
MNSYQAARHFHVPRGTVAYRIYKKQWNICWILHMELHLYYLFKDLDCKEQMWIFFFIKFEKVIFELFLILTKKERKYFLLRVYRSLISVQSKVNCSRGNAKSQCSLISSHLPRLHHFYSHF